MTVTVLGIGQISIVICVGCLSKSPLLAFLPFAAAVTEDGWIGLMYCVTSSSRSGTKRVSAAEAVARILISVKVGVVELRRMYPSAVFVVVSLVREVVNANSSNASIKSARASKSASE